MRVAIIGGGAAGLAAAWALARDHRVTLYERHDWLGGHARTIDVPTATGTVPVDMGFLVFHDWIYTNFSALLRRLGVESVATPPQTTSVSFPGGSWISGASTPFWETVRAEAERFQRELPDVVADPLRYAQVSLGDYLFGRGYSDAFVYQCVCPVGGSRFVTRRGVLSLSVLEFAAGFGPANLYSVLHPTYWRTVRGGMREYVKRISEPFADHVRLSTPVASIQRDTRGVLVQDGQSRGEKFDQVVLATPADVSLRLLSDADPIEKLLLATDYQDTEVVLHTDPAVMPRDRALWAADTYVTTETNPPYSRGWVSYFLPTTQPWVTDNIFVTISPPQGLIDPTRVLKRQTWRHLIADSVQLLRAMELHRIQGRRRVWFCGEFAGMYGGHESSIVTGLAVAKALGADYPFESEPAARRVFYDTAVTHMRIVKGKAPDPAETWWPPVLALTNAAVTRSIAQAEVRKVIRGSLPGSLRRLLSVVDWLDKPLINAIASRVSLVQEAAKQTNTES